MLILKANVDIHAIIDSTSTSLELRNYSQHL